MISRQTDWLSTQLLKFFLKIQTEWEDMYQMSGASKKWPHLKCWAIETRPFRIGARIKQVSYVAVTWRVPNRNPGTP